tara:strand:+ start:3539 stop:3898 length:360 start_codon:yes stop_codon:yes gene_type:complete
MHLPKTVRIGAFLVELILVDHEVMYELVSAEGTFICKPPYKIYLDKEMVQRGGPDAVNVVIHELLHVGYHQYHLKEKEEETIVNSFGNFMTEVLCHSEIKDWIRHETKNLQTTANKRQT